MDEADRMVASGRARVDDFKFMLHLCGWAPGQLEDEIQRGVWMPVATSTNVRFLHCLLQVCVVILPCNLFPIFVLEASLVLLLKKLTRSRRNAPPAPRSLHALLQVILKHCISLPVPMWREVMTLMGPKYGLLARDTYDDL